MSILLIESDAQRQQRWLDRLLTLSTTVTAVASDQDAIQAARATRFTLVICAWRRDQGPWSQSVSKWVNQMRSHAGLLLCVTDLCNTTIEHQAYLAGFDDCLFENCSDEALATKLRHARQLQRIEQRLAQAQKLESIGELAAGIAHEINTPIQYVGDNTRFVQEACADLSRVLRSCQTLLESVDSNHDVHGNIQRLREAMQSADVDYLIQEVPAAISQTLEGVDRVANIVRAMKEFAHPGASELTLTDLSKSIDNTVMVARNEWKYVAEVVTSFDADLPPVPCLPGELNQVLLNLIVNAAHAIADSLGDSSSSKGTITIQTKRLADHAQIRVIDTGSGIRKENLDRIFDPFFTTKAAGKGTGQGLAIAHNVIVEKHGGTIQVESELGVGTTFVIHLPLTPRPSDEPRLNAVFAEASFPSTTKSCLS